MAKLIFRHHYSSLSVTYPSEIILIFLFGAEETFLIFVNVKKQCLIFLLGFSDK